MTYYSRCGDCGGDVEHDQKVSRRRDICDACWKNRGWLLEHRGHIGMVEFQKIQRSMSGHRGTARRRIEKLKREVQPALEVSSPSR